MLIDKIAMENRTVILAFVALAVTVACGAVGADDRIYPVGGGTAIAGTIKEVTHDRIVIDVKNSPQSFDVNEILRVQWDSEPTAFSRIKEHIAEGQWEEADQELSRLDEKSLKSEGLKKDFEFYRGYVQGQLALLGKKDLNSAVKSLVAFKNSNPQTHHFYKLIETLGDLATRLGSYENAKAFYSELAAAPFPEYKMRGKYLSGKAQLQQGNSVEARKNYTDVLSINPEGSALPRMRRLQQLARVGNVRCDIVDDKAEAANKLLAVMIKDGDSTDSELFAAIYNARGDAYAKLGQNELAVLAYLHTDQLFSAQPESHAEALHYLSQLFAKIGEPLKAAEAKSKLTMQYPGSLWLQK